MAKRPQDLIKNSSFDELMDFLAEDEQQAIDGYEEVINQIDDEFVKEQLRKIIKEEQDHKKYLEEVKKNHKLEYVDKGGNEDGK